MALRLLELLPLLTSLACVSLLPRAALGASGVRLFVLGDSLLDTGNSVSLSPPVQNYTCNFGPYGQDLRPTAGPTGRCCNGKVLTDFISAGLGYSAVPNGPLQGGPFTHGSNAATAGAPAVLANNYGVSTYSGDVQLQAIKTILWGSATALTPLPDVLMYIELGSNDLINYYYKTPFLKWSRKIDPYSTILVNKIVKLVKDAYAFGVRNFIVGNMNPAGCSPILRSIAKSKGYPFGGCIGFANSVAQNYNRKLATALTALTISGGPIPGARLIQKKTWDMYYRAARLTRLNVANKRCCGEGLKQCGLPGTFKCKDTRKYFWWDGAHPTEFVNSKIWDLFWTGSTAYMTPMNGSTLVRMMNT